MKKFTYTFILCFICTAALSQSWTNTGNALQQQTNGTYKNYRFNLGAPGFLNFYTKFQIDSINTAAPGIHYPLVFGTGMIAGHYDGSVRDTIKNDTGFLQTVANLFPRADTRYYTKAYMIQNFAQIDTNYAPVTGQALVPLVGPNGKLFTNPSFTYDIPDTILSLPNITATNNLLSQNTIIGRGPYIENIDTYGNASSIRASNTGITGTYMTTSYGNFTIGFAGNRLYIGKQAQYNWIQADGLNSYTDGRINYNSRTLAFGSGITVTPIISGADTVNTISVSGSVPCTGCEVTSNKVTTLDNSTIHYPSTSAIQPTVTQVATNTTNIATNSTSITTARDTISPTKLTFNTGNLVTGVSALALTGMTAIGNVIDGTGSNDYVSHQAYVSTEDCQDKIDLLATFSPVAADGSGNIYFQTMKNSYTAGTIVQVLHNGTSGTDSLRVLLWDRTAGKATTAYEYALPFTVATGYTYLVHQGKRTGGLLIDVWRSDGLHYQNNGLQQNVGNNFGDQWGYPTVGVYAGHVQVTQFYYNTAFSRTPKLVAWMDSFGEGNSLSSFPGTYNNRYIYLLAQAIGLDQVTILARGGESTVSVATRFSGELQWFAGAKYGLIALGTNDVDTVAYKANILSMASQLVAKGIIPILCTITPRSDGANNNHAIVLQQNTFIRNSGYKYIDFNAAFTQNSDGLWARPGYQQGDSVHPTPVGMVALYNQFIHDAPYVLTAGADSTALYPHYMKIPTFHGTPSLNGYPNYSGANFGVNLDSFRLGVLINGTYYDYEPYSSLISNGHTINGFWQFTNNIKAVRTDASKNAITSYRNQNLSNGASAGGLALDGNDSGGTEVTLANLYGTMVTNTPGSVSGGLALNLPVAGAQTTLFNWYPTGNFSAATTDGGYTFYTNRSGTNGYASFGSGFSVNASGVALVTTPGSNVNTTQVVNGAWTNTYYGALAANNAWTGAETHSGTETYNNTLTANNPVNAFANVVSSLATSSGKQFTAERAQVVTAGGSAGLFNSDANNSASTEKTYVQFGAQVVSNTSTAESGEFVVNIINAGTIATKLAVYNSGNGVFGGGSDIAGATNSVQGTGGYFNGLYLSGTSSGKISIVPQAAAGTYNLNLPTTLGSAGQVWALGATPSSSAGVWVTPGTVTSITPGYGFTSATPITTTGTLTIDTANHVVDKINLASQMALKASVPIAVSDLTGQTASNASVVTYTTPANGTYRIGGYLNITSNSVDQIAMYVTYTDVNSNVVTSYFYSMGSTTSQNSGTGSSSFPTIDIRAKSGTAITIKTTATTVGTVAYGCGGTITKLR